MKIDWEDYADVVQKFKLIDRLFPPTHNTLNRLDNLMNRYKGAVNKRLKAKSQEEYDELTIAISDYADEIDVTFTDLYRLFESFTTGDPFALEEENRPE